MIVVLMSVCFIVAFAGIIYTSKLREQKKTAIFASSFVSTVLLPCILYASIYYASNYYTEYWCGYGNSVVMHEGYWTTITTTDSKGNTTTHRIYIPPSYYINDINGSSVSIDSGEYDKVAKYWGHNPTHNWDLGRTYTYNWDGNTKTKLCITSQHQYRNKTQNIEI